MPNRNHSQKIAEDTLAVLKQGYFFASNGEKIDISDAQQFAQNQTITYAPAMTDELIKAEKYSEFNKATEIEVTGETTMNAVRRLIEEGEQQVLCLNFASAKNAGGGFLGGSQAQEESIARATGLYPCLLTADEYYQTNRKTNSCFYTDYMIYSPQVPIIKNEEGDNMDQLMTFSVITAPAVNAGIVKARERERIGEIELVMKRRIEKVLAIALEHKHLAIVLGAWGCGVFQNDPKEIAQYFKEVIATKFPQSFKKIVFAIYANNERFIKPFQDRF